MKGMTPRDCGCSILTQLLLISAACLLYFGHVLFAGSGLYGGDFIFQFYPWKKFVFDHVWKHGSLPFWNPYLLSGTPFVTNIQASVFYPPGILYYFFPPPFAYSVSTFLHCVLGGMGMLFFMRAFSVHFAGRLLSAWVFTFSGFFMAHLFAGHLSFIQTYVWIPWVFLAFHRFQQNLHLTDAAAVALLLGLQILGGFPQIAFYTLFAVALYAMFTAAMHLKGHRLQIRLRSSQERLFSFLQPSH
jgi:hypothetical protein